MKKILFGLIIFNSYFFCEGVFFSPVNLSQQAAFIKPPRFSEQVLKGLDKVDKALGSFVLKALDFYKNNQKQLLLASGASIAGYIFYKNSQCYKVYKIKSQQLKDHKKEPNKLFMDTVMPTFLGDCIYLINGKEVAKQDYDACYSYYAISMQ